MCTRFAIEPETEELQDILEAVRRSRLTGRFLEAGAAVLYSGEIRPTDVVPVIAPDKNGAEAVFPMRWGFRIPGGPLLVNARSETAADKPSFREAWKRHRCVIPASCYFEWEHFGGADGRRKTGDKYRIRGTGSASLRLAGLYRVENGFPVFTVLTREPTEELKRLHDRMPLLLPSDRVSDWIDPRNAPEEFLPFAVTELRAERVG